MRAFVAQRVRGRVGKESVTGEGAVPILPKPNVSTGLRCTGDHMCVARATHGWKYG